LKRLIGDADWGDLDYFLIDLPPGTSDIHLTVVQTLAMTGAIVVSTPQAVALADARKGINMFTNDKVNVPIFINVIKSCKSILDFFSFSFIKISSDNY